MLYNTLYKYILGLSVFFHFPFTGTTKHILVGFWGFSAFEFICTRVVTEWLSAGAIKHTVILTELNHAFLHVCIFQKINVQVCLNITLPCFIFAFQPIGVFSDHFYKEHLSGHHEEDVRQVMTTSRRPECFYIE